MVRAINRAWTEADFDSLAALLHPDVVFVQPGFAGRVEGREACVESYREFVSQAEVLSYREDDPQVDVTGDVAVVTYAFDIRYDMGGTRYHDTGRDLFVLARDGDRWLAVWRTLLPETSVEEA